MSSNESQPSGTSGVVGHHAGSHGKSRDALGQSEERQAFKSQNLGNSTYSQSTRSYQPIARAKASQVDKSLNVQPQPIDPMSRWQQEDPKEQPWNAIAGIYTGSRSDPDRAHGAARALRSSGSDEASVNATRGSVSEK